MIVKPTYEELAQQVKELEQSNSVNERTHGSLWGSEETFKKIADVVPVQISIIALEGETRYLYVVRSGGKSAGGSEPNFGKNQP